ncbi:DUF6082 family protein [Actinoplanes sp. NPDC051861]|uniref:DUF6082 family protein n=1 Tax=Actinoplanes sp. NPDC051861 TaxID=3155170 RepID=UPI00343E8FF9
MSSVPEPVIGSKRTSRAWLAVGVACAVILAAVLIASVVVMLRMPDSTLDRLSDTGQAIGIFSTLFSAAALIGVVLSVTYQSRQNQRYDYEAWHSAHAGLLARVIEDPATFAPCIGNSERFSSELEARRYYFTTLWLNFGQIGLRAGNMTEASIREELCGEMFESQVARDLWMKRRENLARNFGGLSPFYQLVDDEFERTYSAPPNEAQRADAGSEITSEAGSRSLSPPTQ